jgi:predicted ATPase
MQGVNAISDTRPFADNSIAAQEKAPDKRALQQENASSPSLSGKGKLYDRGHEQLELLKAYQSVCQGGTTNFVLISGKAGSGKSSLALSLKNTVLSEGGYFIKGKFDLNVRSGEPYAAIAAAFAEFTNQVISHGEASVAAMREAINKAIAAEGNILINTIPALKSLLGDQRQATSAQGSEAISRFIFVFRFFLRAISSPSKPLVLLIDDWHWADQCSLDLLASLIPDKENSGVLFVGTCRDDVDSKSALSNMLRSLEKKNVAITNISATNLNKEALVHMLSDFLLVPVKDVLPFADLVHEHTSGNSLYVIEFLRLLKEKNVLSYDCQKHRWEWSDGVSLMMAQGSGVDDLIVTKLRALPAEVQEVLRVASFMGATTNRVFLTYVISSSMDDYLNAAIDCGFLLFDQQQNIITFQHDCIQEAAYALTPEDGRVAKHLSIGRKLWRSMSDGELEGNVFVVLNQLHRGFDLISSQKERYAVASLCLVAAEKAARASTFRRSAVHLELGIVLLGPKTWRDQYALTLAIHNAAAEVCYCTGEFDRVDQYVNAIFQNGRTFSDKLRAHATHVYALGARSKMGEALDAGLEVLKRLGRGRSMSSGQQYIPEMR